MRSAFLLLALALVPLVGALPAPAPAAPIAVTYSPSTGEINVGPGPNMDWFIVDTCTTASPGVPECTGINGPHEAVAPPGSYMQALLYPRAIASATGGNFEIVLEWESGIGGVRCAVPAGALSPAMVVCEEIGNHMSYDWLDESWTLRARQDAGILGAIQATVVFDGSI